MNNKSIIKKKFKLYWPLIKSMQTALLLVTGITGYVSARCPVMTWEIFAGLTISLFLTVSGSTILNMWYDRDIDAKMDRTKHRPLPLGTLNPTEALLLGLIVSIMGVGLALSMSFIFGVVVFAGLFIDVVIYTIWLKPRTHLNILIVVAA